MDAAASSLNGAIANVFCDFHVDDRDLDIASSTGGIIKSCGEREPSVSVETPVAILFASSFSLSI